MLDADVSHPVYFQTGLKTASEVDSDVILELSGLDLLCDQSLKVS